MPKYLVIRQFRDASGVRFPGEYIELTPSRATLLRDNGLVGTQQPAFEPESSAAGEENERKEAPTNASDPQPKKTAKGKRRAGK